MTRTGFLYRRLAFACAGVAVAAACAAAFVAPSVLGAFAADGAAVAKAGGEEFATLQEAVDAAEAGSQVTLLADTKENVKVSNKAITIDLAGYKLTGLGNDSVLFASKSDLTIENGIVTGGRGGLSKYGGAVSAYSGSSFTARKVTFDDNSATGGGGAVYTVGDLEIKDCSFTGNEALNGAAVYTKAKDPVIEGTTFEDNAATGWGGAVFADGCNLTMTGCTFKGNAAVNAGAFYTQNTTSALKDCTFVSNTATNGGAVRVQRSVLNADDSTFIGNTAKNGTGGALYNMESTTVVHLKDCTFEKNTSSYSGGALFTSCDTTLDGCSVTGSSAESGAVFFKSNDAKMVDTVVTGNTGTASMYSYDRNSAASGVYVEKAKLHFESGAVYNNAAKDPALAAGDMFFSEANTASSVIDASDMKDGKQRFASYAWRDSSGALVDAGHVTSHVGGYDIVVPDCVYLDPSKGDDANGGLRSDDAVKTPEAAVAALEKLRETNAEATKVYVLGTVKLEDGQTLQGGHAVFTRATTNKRALFSVPSGRTVTFKDVTVDGNSPAVTGGATLVEVNGVLVMEDGTTLQNNDVSNASYSNSWGGAVRVNSGGLFQMKGGTIKGCKALAGGAVYTSGVFQMEGGSLEGNTVTSASQRGNHAVGAGVVVTYLGKFYLKGGSISNNVSGYNGGGVALGGPNTAFYGSGGAAAPYMEMTGGVIDGNRASSCGGGIFVQCNCEAVVRAGKITNNVALSDYALFSGGGIYVNGATRNLFNTSDTLKEGGKESTYKNGILHLYNAIVTDNSASGEGAGLASCPTSMLKVYVTDGAAIFGNKTKDGIGELFITCGQYGSHAGNPQGYISSSMLGGGAYNWTNVEDGTAYDGNSEFLLSRASGTPYLHLNNDPSGIEAAQKLATVEISGNSSKSRGGGIGSNGDVFIGTASVQIEGKKMLDGEAASGSEFEFELKSMDGTVLQTVSNEDGTIRFDPIAYNAPGTYEYLVTEKKGSDRFVDYDASTFHVVVDVTENLGIYTNDCFKVATRVEKDYQAVDGIVFINTSREIEKRTVEGSKTWDDADNAASMRPESITIRLYANGEEADSRVVTAEDGWAWKFEGLPIMTRGGDTIDYSISEDPVTGYETAVDGFDVTNTVIPEDARMEIAVSKVWVDDDDAASLRPGYVTIALKANGADTGLYLVLNEENSWKGSFTNLPRKTEGGNDVVYTVEELEVAGYTGKTVLNEDGSFTVTNTVEPTVPAEDEETPLSPGEPNNPTTTKKVDEKAPTSNSDGSATVIEDDDTPLSSGVDTGDDGPFGILVIASLAALALAGALLVIAHRPGHRRE